MWRLSIIVVVVASRADAGPAPLVLPQVAPPIRIDGELDEVAWRSPARTGPFVDAAGAQAAPYCEARFLRDDNYLYLAMYAADEDIRSSDEFVVELSSSRGRSTFQFTARGKISPAIAGAHAAVDIDGSLDASDDDDEEWIVEAALPLASIPFARDASVTVRVSRCDTPKDHIKRCGAWSGSIVRRR
jgi:hypothetical protein